MKQGKLTTHKVKPINKVMFERRTKSLLKKAFEFSTLCNVRTSLIIYAPNSNTNNGEVKPETWPPNHEEVKKIVQLSKAKDTQVRIDLPQYFMARKQKADKELEQLHGKECAGGDDQELDLPTWYDRMGDFSEDELMGLMNTLETKHEIVTKRLGELLTMQSGQFMNLDSGNFQQPPVSTPFQSGQGPEQLLFNPNYENSQMMMTMNGGDCTQFGGYYTFTDPIYAPTPPAMLSGSSSSPLTMQPCRQHRIMSGVSSQQLNVLPNNPSPSPSPSTMLSYYMQDRMIPDASSQLNYGMLNNPSTPSSSSQSYMQHRIMPDVSYQLNDMPYNSSPFSMQHRIMPNALSQFNVMMPNNPTAPSTMQTRTII